MSQTQISHSLLNLSNKTTGMEQPRRTPVCPIGLVHDMPHSFPVQYRIQIVRPNSKVHNVKFWLVGDFGCAWIRRRIVCNDSSVHLAERSAAVETRKKVKQQTIIAATHNALVVASAVGPVRASRTSRDRGHAAGLPSCP